MSFCCKEEYNTFAQWYLHNMYINLCFENTAPEQVDSIDDPEDLQTAKQDLHSFFQKLYEDMYNEPKKYSIPVEVYPDDARFNKRRLNVAGVVRNVIVDFLYRLGQAGTYDGGLLKIESQEYEKLVKEKSKKINFSSFIDALRQLGLNIIDGDVETCVTSTNTGHNEMLIALSSLAKACEQHGSKGIYHFQRCYFRALGPKFTLDLNDVLQVLPEPFRSGLDETDLFLRQCRYRRKIELYNDFGYRIIYSNKAGVVCYCHVNSYLDKNLYMYVRWVLDTEQSTKLFDIVGKDSPEYADYIFNSICKCDPECVPGFGAPTPDTCIARIKVERNGRSIYVCKDARWDKFNDVSQDFTYVRRVLGAISQVL